MFFGFVVMTTTYDEKRTKRQSPHLRTNEKRATFDHKAIAANNMR
jgi:hypothetical protein